MEKERFLLQSELTYLLNFSISTFPLKTSLLKRHIDYYSISHANLCNYLLHLIINDPENFDLEAFNTLLKRNIFKEDRNTHLKHRILMLKFVLEVADLGEQAQQLEEKFEKEFAKNKNKS